MQGRTTHQWSRCLHQSHLHSRPTKVFSLLWNYQRLPYPSFRTHPHIIHDAPGNFQYCPHHYQGLHFCHPAHACASRTTYTIQQSASLTPCTLTTHTERHPKKSSNLPPSKSSLTNNFTNHAIHL